MESNVAMESVPSIAKRNGRHYSLKTSYLALLCAYLVTICVGIVLIAIIRFSNDVLIESLVVDLICSCVIFVFSFIFDNSSIYDPYPSVSNFLIAVYWYFRAKDKFGLQKILGMIGIISFCLKEQFFYFKKWKGLDFEDLRFTATRESVGNRVWIYWLQSFGLYHVMTTAIVFTAMLPLYFIISTDDYSTMWIVITGFGVVCAGIMIDPVVFWIGLYVMLLGVNTDYWWMFFSPVAMFAYLLIMNTKLVEIKYEDDHFRIMA